MKATPQHHRDLYVLLEGRDAAWDDVMLQTEYQTLLFTDQSIN